MKEMNWWKGFKVGKQLSPEDIHSFLTYLRLDSELMTEKHSMTANEFPSIRYELREKLLNNFIPSEQWLQWTNFYLIQTSNRFGIDETSNHSLDDEYFDAGSTFAQEVEKYSATPILCIADFPTKQLISFALGAKNICEPIIGFDSLPHPNGISSAKNLLEMLLQYKDEFALHYERNIPLLLLDSNRLVAYSDNPILFDNRSTAKLPTIESLKARNIATIIYATNSDGDIDDVHEDFCYYINAGFSLLWYNLQNGNEIKEKQFVKRSTMFSKRTSFINKV